MLLLCQTMKFIKAPKQMYVLWNGHVKVLSNHLSKKTTCFKNGLQNKAPSNIKFVKTFIFESFFFHTSVRFYQIAIVPVKAEQIIHHLVIRTNS